MHLTIRMAWHDNGWDGKICQDPKQNAYCVGNNSLLSNRLRKNRDLDLEIKNAGKKLDQLGDYLPPCYWSSNAFSADTTNIWHDHPWLPKRIDGSLTGYSVFTWPFNISYTDYDEKKKWGRYPPQKVIEKRLDKLEDELTSGDSLVFFYLNYSNPISSDWGQYVLVGCAPLIDISKTGEFDLSDKELQNNRRGEKKNFSALNWAIRVTYDFEESGIMLPYKDYLKHIDKHPSDEYMLDEMQVLIEDDMRANFKYVAMGMNDDVCIYLLTKLKKSLYKVSTHDILDTAKIDAQQKRVEHLLQRAWKKRGIYPGLGNVLDVIGEVEKEDYGVGNEIVNLLRDNSGSADILDVVFSILSGASSIPDYLKKYYILKDMMIYIRDYDVDLLKKLSLFSLTATQISNILDASSMQADPEEIISNPYVLCEEYSPSQSSYTDDKISIGDAKIPLFVIDIGMFPDSKFLGRNSKLQDLTPTAPQRIRAIVREYLKSLDAIGDCFAPLENVLHYIDEHPLFSKERLNINKNQLVSENGKYAGHFEGNIVIKHNDGGHYFYLKEIQDAERRIAKGIRSLLGRDNYEYKNTNSIDLTSDVDELSEKIQSFPKDDFVRERQRLTNGILSKSLYVVTGIPGSGKTKALEAVIDKLRNVGEGVTLLAPTGKAALRLGNRARTIDKLIYDCKYNDILDDPRKDVEDTRQRPKIENLIIDEASMLDLIKLDVLFRMITDPHGNVTAKRVVFVGDPNQLPPIGYGKPFYDIIKIIRKKYSDSNYVQLQVNCRQDDPGIIDIARIFEYGKDDYDAGRLARIASGNYVQSGFKAISWQDGDDLERKIDARLDDMFDKTQESPSSKSHKLNQLLGLDKNGYVNKRNPDTLNLDAFQILCPHRSRGLGTTAHINDYMQTKYRDIELYSRSRRQYEYTSFFHSDKIISTSNKKERGNMILANGSIGIINIDAYNPYDMRIYFSDGAAYLSDTYKKFLPAPKEDYELAYAITVHKSQGSEFDHTFVVIPNRSALLSKELIYTALTRATKNVTLFVQAIPDNRDSENVLDYARRRSDIRQRLTSIFSEPTRSRKIFEPEKGTFVRSKVEYILYNKLKESGIKFKYERKLKCMAYGRDTHIEIQPDFTITVDGTEYYLEHLGMLGNDEYRKVWDLKRKTYESNGLIDRLVTTDDQHGIQDESIDKLLGDIVRQKLKVTQDNPYSLHHYTTYH